MQLALLFFFWHK